MITILKFITEIYFWPLYNLVSIIIVGESSSIAFYRQAILKDNTSAWSWIDFLVNKPQKCSKKKKSWKTSGLRLLLLLITIAIKLKTSWRWFNKMCWHLEYFKTQSVWPICLVASFRSIIFCADTRIFPMTVSLCVLDLN